MPWTRDRMQPADVFDLVEGDQEQWQRQVLLTAWSTWFITMSMPMAGNGGWRSQCRTFYDFLDKFVPPGYVRPKERPKKKRR